VGYGRSVPNGHLPVFSVDTEEEARTLITMACPMDLSGQHFARELAIEQTLENLEAFSDRLEQCWKLVKKRKRTANHTT
jgi:hypothetical protein